MRENKKRKTKQKNGLKKSRFSWHRASTVLGCAVLFDLLLGAFKDVFGWAMKK